MRFIYLLFLLTITNTAFSQEHSFFTINSSLLKNADAVVRLDENEILIKSSDNMEVISKRVITVLNEKGNEHVNAMAYYDKETNIRELEASIYDANGNQLEKFKEKDFIDQTATGEGTLYSDSRVKYLHYTPVSYPYTVMVSKKFTTSDTAFMPRWYFMDGYRISVEKSSFTLQVPSGINFRYKDNNLQSYAIKRIETQNGIKYTATELQAIESEDFDPEFRDFAPNVQFALEDFNLKGVNGHAKNWKEFGSWIYNSLIQEQGELDPSTVQKIKTLVGSIEKPKDKVKKIYQFVQDNTRYISVQMGIGGWMPMSAKEVDRVKYGDCKGLTNYTMALLNAIGIPSYYTIVSADSSKRNLDADFPSLQGNHAFLNVPLAEGDMWLECTSQLVPADYLGTFTDDRYVLKVGPEGGELVKSRTYSPQDSQQFTSATVSLGENGIQAIVEITSTGIQYDQKYMLATKSKEEIERHYKNYWDYVNDIHILNHKVQNDKEHIVFNELVTINTSGYFSKAGQRILFAPNMFNRNSYVPKRDTERAREIVIKRGYTDEDDFLIEYPKNYVLDTSLAPVQIKNSFGEFTVSIERVSENQLRYKRKLLIKPGVFPSTDYAAYRNFRKDISKADASKIVFIKI